MQRPIGGCCRMLFGVDVAHQQGRGARQYRDAVPLHEIRSRCPFTSSTGCCGSHTSTCDQTRLYQPGHRFAVVLYIRSLYTLEIAAEDVFASCWVGFGTLPVAWRKRDASRSGGCSRAQDGVICKEAGANNRFRELKAGAVGNASHHWTQAPVSLEKFGANKTDPGKAEEESLVDVGWVVGSLAGGTQFTAVCQPARKTQ